VLEAAVGHVPARVFGSSGGAVTGLALVARYPDHVETLIAHEAPLALLLPEAERARSGFHDIYDTFSEKGIGAAWEAFATFTGLTMGLEDVPTDPTPPSAEEVATSTRFFEHGLLPIALYHPDFPALEVAPTRLIVAGGTASRGELPQRTAVVLAERLRTPLMNFPGGHVGFLTEPVAFASLLTRALA
jgi:pimeloyl-ACP methyl ester carboxylesterase